MVPFSWTPMFVNVPSVSSPFSFTQISSKTSFGNGRRMLVLWYRNGFEELTLCAILTFGFTFGAGIALVVTSKCPSLNSSILLTMLGSNLIFSISLFQVKSSAFAEALILSICISKSVMPVSISEKSVSKNFALVSVSFHSSSAVELHVMALPAS